MTDSATIYQCPECLRQHDGALRALPFRPCVPEMKVCGLADCGSVADENDALEQRRAERWHARWKERHPAAPCRAELKKVTPAPGPAPRREPYPPDSEDERRLEPVQVGADLSAAAVNQCEAMLAEFLKTFPNEWLFETFPRPDHRSQWLSNAHFAALRTPAAPHGITRPNSRASTLNVGQTSNGIQVRAPHELITRHQLWIDSRGSGENTERSLCYREHSLRLKSKKENP